MWFCPEKYNKKLIVNVNERLKELKGELDDKEARLTLIDFLRSNLGLTVELISGIKLAPYQEITLKGMMDKHRTMCVWGRGGSKTNPYTKNTYLLSKKDGMISIIDLFPNVDFSLGERWVDTEKSIEVWNGESWVRIEKMLIQPQKPCRRLITSRGYTLEGSVNHLIQTWNAKTCEIEWKKYQDIQKGDWAIISRQSVNFENQALDADTSYLVGLAIGDGCFSPNNNNGMKITSADQSILDFCLFHGAYRLSDKSGPLAAKDACFPLFWTKDFLAKTGLKRTLSYDKFIPNNIFKSKNSIKACLQGLFDTDGSVNKWGGKITFSSTSRTLAFQVQLALSLFGIIAKRTEHKTKSSFGKVWIVSIAGYDAFLYAHRIGFRLERKQNLLLSCLENRIFNTNLNVIPGIKDYCQKKIKSPLRLKREISLQWRNQIRRKNNQKEISYNTLRKYNAFFKENCADAIETRKLDRILEANVFFDLVEDISDIEKQDCLDFSIPEGEKYWSNGLISHNSFMAAVFCFCQTIFEPNSKIMLAGPTFRTSRIIFSTYLEKIVKSPGAELLMQAFNKPPSKRNDQFEWEINGGSITAIPLNGEKIRGFRANVIVIDEYLLMPQDIIDNVLKPFLTAPLDIEERIKIRELEDKLIINGLLREEQRVKFENNSKMIALSSASYTFENLHTTFKDWKSKIYSPEDEEDGCSYFISQLSYEALPLHMIDKSVTEEAKNGGSSRASFLREYCAQFVDESDGYFSAKKMNNITLADGESPATLVSSREGKKYILSIDPSFSKSKTSDFFAMSVLELNEENKDATLVHGYAVAGGDLKNHIKYLFYLLTHFNIEIIIIDNAGYQFIDAANESVIFKENRINLGFFEVDTELEGQEYQKMLHKARSTWNTEKRVICIKQIFTSEFIRKSNQYLQNCIDTKHIWFASNVRANANAWEKAVTTDIDIRLTPFENVGELAEFQDDIIYQTKKQCALIEVVSTAKGTQTFDLPQHLRRDNTEKRARKDNYTALLLGNWATKLYYDLIEVHRVDNATFVPFFV